MLIAKVVEVQCDICVHSGYLWTPFPKSQGII